MENVQLGDIVGWRFSLFNDEDENAEYHGEVVAMHGDFLCLRSLHVTSPIISPFHGRPRSMCHMVKKKAA